MTDWLRRAGRGRVADGGLVVWSVAEGIRGRRWRWTVTERGGLVVSGLAERLPSGAFGRLELAVAGGLLTFHPDPGSASAHGNIVASDGVRPIAIEWDERWGVGIEGDPFGSAACGWSGGGLIVSYRDGLAWRGPGRDADIAALASDEREIPILEGSEEWALEADSEA
jgi:hypothetical protein